MLRVLALHYILFDMNSETGISIVQTLRSCGFFASVDEPTIRKIAATATVEAFGRGEMIFPEGAECRGMYIVARGTVKVYKIGPDGREHVLHVAEPGDIFGEAALFLGQGYPAYAAAVRNSSLVLLRRTAFVELLRSDPELCFKLLGAMSIWAHRLVSKLEMITLRDAGERLASYMLGRAGESGEFELTVPKSTLAAELDIASETLSRLFSRFEAQGAIEVDGRRIRVVDREMLEENAAGS